MNVMNHIILTIVIVLFALSIRANGQTPPSDPWPSLIRKNSVIETVDQLRDGMQWPVIVSSYRANLMPEQERVEMLQRIDAIRDLVKKVDASFAAKEPVNQAELQDDVKMLLVLAEKAKLAGGYTNLVLADSLNRLVIYRVASWLVAHPDDAAFCAKLLSLGPAVDPNYIDVLRQTVGDDERFNGKKLDLTAINPKGSIFQSLAPIGISQDDVLASMGSESAKTSILLAKPSAVTLASRTTETAALKDVYLAGLVAFFEKGGSIAELNPADITAFEQRMGKSTRDYKCPEFGIRRLSADYLLALIELHKNKSAGTSFLRMALQ